MDFAELYRGVTIAYCPLIEELPRIMRRLRPTIIVAVPRVYEKIYNQVQRAVAAVSRSRIPLGDGHRRAHLDKVLDGRRPSVARLEACESRCFRG